MKRGTAVLITLLVALVAVGGIVVATTGTGRTSDAGAAPDATATVPAATPAAAPESVDAAVGAPAGIDPNDPALVFGDDDACAAPCSKLNVPYGSATSVLNPEAGRQTLSLDLFRSRRTPSKDAPVVMLLHGGGFVTGDRTLMRTMAEVLANAGFLVASIQYRLVPKERNAGAGIAREDDILVAAEEATEDTQMAMRYIRKNARRLGATTERDRYAVGGYSAGAIAALRVALRGGDRATPASRRWKVGAGFAISGFECGSWTRSYGCRGAYDEADPPVQMFHGEADSIVSYSWGRDTCRDAELSGGGCQLFSYPEQDHFWSSGTVYGGAQNQSRTRPAIVPTVAKFLRRELAKD